MEDSPVVLALLRLTLPGRGEHRTDLPHRGGHLKTPGGKSTIDRSMKYPGEKKGLSQKTHTNKQKRKKKTIWGSVPKELLDERRAASGAFSGLEPAEKQGLASGYD